MRVSAFLGLVAAASSAAASASAADFGPIIAAPSAAYFGHALPPCTDPGVLKDIARKFAYGDARVVHSGLTIVGIDGVRETRYKDGPSLTNMRYCTGTASFDSGKQSEVVFIIEGPMKGKYSIGWAVESCLPGLDPYRVYDGDCRSIRG
jgi:hypothetical protein